MKSLLAVPPVDPLAHLIACWETAAPLLPAAARDLGSGRSLAFLIGDEAVRFDTTETGIEMRTDAIDDAELVARMSPDHFAALAVEAWSLPGLVFNGHLEVLEGRWDLVMRWEAALQALLYGRPIYDESAAAEGGRTAARSFDLDAEFDGAVEFLAQAGFVHLRGVFDADEVRAIGDEVERIVELSTPDDGRSWWTTDADGNEVCCRTTYLADRSVVIGALEHDARLHRAAALAPMELRPAPDRMDGYSCVIKRYDSRSGLSDLPWHRDCGMGGHPVICPGLNLGVQLDAASEANGRLGFLAGSHHHAGPLRPDVPGAPIVWVDTEPGDVTVHYGHCMHVAPPPRSPEVGRRALYCGFYAPELFDVIGPFEAFNDVLFEHDGGRIATPDEF